MYSNFINVFTCTIRYFVRYSLNIAPCNCLRELFGDSWTKTLQYLMRQIEVSFIYETGISSDRKTLELLTVSLSFEDVLPRLTFTGFCFICGTVTLVFICDYRKCRKLSELYFLFFWLNVTPYFHVWTATHALQFSSETVPVAQCSFINHKPPYCFLLFHTLTLFCVDCHTFLPLFPTFLSLNVRQIPYVSSPLSLCECHTCESPFSLCECHTNILVPPLLLSGHSTLFPFKS